MAYKWHSRTALLAVCAIVAVGLQWVPVWSAAAEVTNSAGAAGRAAGSYPEYRLAHAGDSPAAATVEIGAENLTDSTGQVRLLDGYGGEAGPCLETGEDGVCEFRFTVPEAGLYTLTLEYHTVEGKTGAVVRRFELDGAAPFHEMENVSFSRLWQDKLDKPGAFLTDARGNQIRPAQAERAQWITAPLANAETDNGQAFQVAFTAGEHTLRLVSVREAAVIRRLTLAPPPALPDYKAYYDAARADSRGQRIVVQAEHASLKSDSMLYPAADISSATPQPSNPSRTVVNTVAASRWNVAGQWLEWQVPVSQSGYYHIGIKALQNINGGLFSSRSLTIDGDPVFRELGALQFPYDGGWQTHVLGDGDGAYRIWLNKGVRTLRLTAVLGSMETVAANAVGVIDALNRDIRRIMMITGTEPDLYRDYNFPGTIPQVLTSLREQAAALRALEADIVTQSGKRGEHTQILRKLYLQLEAITKKPRSIAGEFVNLRSNVSALGTWLSTVKSQPLGIDYIVVASPDQSMPKTSAGFFANVRYHLGAFIASFFQDYSQNAGGGGDPLTVWLGSGSVWAGTAAGGRDQVQALRQMVTNDFYAKHDVPVNVQLVAANSLLPAVSAGRGPDIALTLGAGDPVNFAVRDAVLDLSGMPGFDEVEARFMPSAMDPLRFGGGVYGVPETQNFSMMFYRRDILAELGVAVPKTWDDVRTLLPILQKKQMSFGMPAIISDGGGVGSALGSFNMFLYQNGGQLYSENGDRCLPDTDLAVGVFADWAAYYTDYGLSRQYDVANRFRAGDMPLVIADYGVYNQLSVFAPELKGLWSFTKVPGTRREDGTVNHATTGAVSATVIMARTKQPENAWRFVDWWTCADTQADFGQELESIVGVAARYATANQEALERISWSSAELACIRDQRQYVVGVPEVAGGYFAGRHIDFAVRDILDNGVDPGETLEDAVSIINEEIRNKRKEFDIQ